MQRNSYIQYTCYKTDHEIKAKYKLSTKYLMSNFMMNSEVVHILEKGQDEWGIIRALTAEDDREDAFYVCDLGDIVKKHNNWLKKLPRVKPHYAVKSNYNPEVLRTLAALGAGFDCASKTEIQLVLQMGVHPNRIIYANPVKVPSHLKYAKKNDVQVMTFDNEYELQNIRNFFPQAKLILRIRYDAAASAVALGDKFGCDAFFEAPEILDTAKSMDLEVIGVSFHVGSDCNEPSAFYRAIAACRHVFNYGNSTGHKLHVLNIGGGFPGNKGTSIDEIADTVNAALNEYFPDPNIEVIAEPGRYYVASAYTLVCNVYSKKKKTSASKLETMMYYINDGIYISFLSVFIHNLKLNPIPLKKRSSQLYPSTIWGPTCDSSDKVFENVMLPEMDIGDWIIFPNMGAYTFAFYSGFNGFPKPSIHVVVSEEIWNYLQGLLLDTKHFVAIEAADRLHKN